MRNTLALTPFRLALAARSVATLAALGTLACFPDKLIAPACTPGTLTQASTNGDTVTTTTGLRYIEGLQGDGPRTDWCHAVQIHYDAFLADGTEFDSSRDSDAPIVFVPGSGALIDGLEQGVIAMNVGGTRRLIIPPSLGFGAEPRRDAGGNIIVPANSTVIYDIEILEVAQ
jgi:FKBP-type peptidyl-prolyl cis-trans isomerase